MQTGVRWTGTSRLGRMCVLRCDGLRKNGKLESRIDVHEIL